MAPSFAAALRSLRSQIVETDRNATALLPTGRSFIFARSGTPGVIDAKAEPSGSVQPEHYSRLRSITGTGDGAVGEPLPSRPDRRFPLAACSARVIKSPGPSAEFRDFLLASSLLACLWQLITRGWETHLAAVPAGQFLFPPHPEGNVVCRANARLRLLASATGQSSSPSFLCVAVNLQCIKLWFSPHHVPTIRPREVDASGASAGRRWAQSRERLPAGARRVFVVRVRMRATPLRGALHAELPAASRGASSGPLRFSRAPSRRHPFRVGVAECTHARLLAASSLRRRRANGLINGQFCCSRRRLAKQCFSANRLSAPGLLLVRFPCRLSLTARFGSRVAVVCTEPNGMHWEPTVRDTKRVFPPRLVFPFFRVADSRPPVQSEALLNVASCRASLCARATL